MSRAPAVLPGHRPAARGRVPRRSLETALALATLLSTSAGTATVGAADEPRVTSERPAAAAAGSGRAATIGFTRVLDGYRQPLLVTHAGGPRRLFVVEQGGRILVARRVDGRWRKQGVFLDLRARVNDPTLPGNGERGLLGLAFHPGYATNGRFYVYHTRAGTGGRDGDAVLAEYRRRTRDTADAGSRRVLLVIDQPDATHNGGNLAFGPDGRLYLGTGDGASDGDPTGRARDPGQLLGKILRIAPRDPDGPGPRRYAIPADNPYAGVAGARPEIWASGLRNPWRFTIDGPTGDLVIGDVGHRQREEIDWSRGAEGAVGGRGVDYGWSLCEGDRAFPGGGPCPSEDHALQPPVFVYDHAPGGPADDGCAVTGGHVFRGPGARAWRGVYLFADVCSGRVSALSRAGTRLLTVDSGRVISSFGQDAAGRLYLVALGGAIWRVEPRGDPNP